MHLHDVCLTSRDSVRTLPAPGGRGAHHVEYEMSTSQLFANSFETGHTFVFDLSDPVHPRLQTNSLSVLTPAHTGSRSNPEESAS